MDIIEAFERFPTQKSCFQYLEKIRWQGKPCCPYCKSKNCSTSKKEGRYHCNKCNTSFSVTVGTIFHKTHLAIQKWLLAVSLILNAKKGISARQLAMHIKVNRNTAWRIAMKIREAMYEPDQRDLLQGIVERDEVWIGGKPRKKLRGGIHKRGAATDKTPVVGIIERYSKIKAKPFIGNVSSLTIQKAIRSNIEC